VINKELKDMKKDYLSKINISILVIISLACFVNKWIFSFNVFPEEDLTFKIMQDSHEDSAMYFHYIKLLSNLDFGNTFSSINSENGFMIMPFGSIIFHTINYKLFGIGSFIFIELLSIFFFLTIFYLIFKELKISDNYAILIATFMFFLPNILEKINYFNINEINTFINHFYSLRFPRPLIANLYFFSFIYFLIISFSKNIFEKKYLIPLSIIASLSFSSFFFIFINQLLCFFIVITLIYKRQLIKFIKIYLTNIIFASLIFFLLAMPFIILILNSNNDYNERLGVNTIDFEEKIFLLKYYFQQLLRLKAIVLYSVIILLYILYKKFFKKNLGILNIFFIIFISSILSPILFVLISKKISFLYHFNNIIIISTILLFIIFVIVFSLGIIKKFNLITSHKILPISLTMILLIIFNFSSYFEIREKVKNDENRLEKNEIFKILKSNINLNLSEAQILTFDSEIMVWGILNNVKYFKIIDGTLSTKSNENIEKDLIESFKFLNLDKNEFINFIKNKKTSYRYLNLHMRQLFWQKYQANSLFTFMESKDFEKQTLEHIKNSSPFYNHQFVIPNFELERLIDKFENFKNNNNFKPDIVLINIQDDIINDYRINQITYCKAFSGSLFNLYLKKRYCE
tara:strand:+ start:648 stop:2540 length:1893 start_codon:yes stop_codon:yes gene_type:complete